MLLLDLTSNTNIVNCLPGDMQVGEGDFFWESNGSSTFPKMAEDVDAQIKQYTEVSHPFLLQDVSCGLCATSVALTAQSTGMIKEDHTAASNSAANHTSFDVCLSCSGVTLIVPSTCETCGRAHETDSGKHMSNKSSICQLQPHSLIQLYCAVQHAHCVDRRASITKLYSPERRKHMLETLQRSHADHFVVTSSVVMPESGSKNQHHPKPDVMFKDCCTLQAVADLNRRTGANVDPTADPNEIMQSNTRNLMSAISSLPQLTERKKVLDKHTNMASALLRLIQARALDQYYHQENDCLHGKSDMASIEKLLQVGQAGSHRPTRHDSVVGCDSMQWQRPDNGERVTGHLAMLLCHDQICTCRRAAFAIHELSCTGKNTLMARCAAQRMKYVEHVAVSMLWCKAVTHIFLGAPSSQYDLLITVPLLNRLSECGWSTSATQHSSHARGVLSGACHVHKVVACLQEDFCWI